MFPLSERLFKFPFYIRMAVILDKGPPDDFIFNLTVSLNLFILFTFGCAGPLLLCVGFSLWQHLFLQSIEQAYGLVVGAPGL